MFACKESTSRKRSISDAELEEKMKSIDWNDGKSSDEGEVKKTATKWKKVYGAKTNGQ